MKNSESEILSIFVGRAGHPSEVTAGDYGAPSRDHCVARQSETHGHENALEVSLVDIGWSSHSPDKHNLPTKELPPDIHNIANLNRDEFDQYLFLTDI